MLCRAFVTIALVCAIPSAYSYSAGAPEQACKNMVPQHQVAPQTSEAPYKLTLSKDKLTAGSDEPIHIKVQGNSGGNTIKGFMIQGRIDGKPVGKFVLPKKSKYVQLLNCGSEGNAITHKKIFGPGPNTIEADWVAPAGSSGTVQFYATVAQNGGIFWVDKLIDVLTIS